MIRFFLDSDGKTFSWRKGMTALVTLVFSYANIGYLHKHDFAELPTSYISIIAGVFAFYFLKKLAEGKKLKITDDEK